MSFVCSLNQWCGDPREGTDRKKNKFDPRYWQYMWNFWVTVVGVGGLLFI